MKVSDYIFHFLKSKNIDTVFTVSGGAAAHLLDSLGNTDFKYVCCYHEQACAMAAEGYARIANKPALVLVTNGPGSTNTLTGVLGAYQDSIPMIVISGQVPVNQSLASTSLELRQLGVQECDIISLVKSVTKYSKQITNKKDVPHILETAYNEATSGRMGPIWLDIPIDIQSSQIELEDDYLNQVIDKLLTAKHPLIITGNGIHLSATEDMFLDLKNILKIPIISTWTSKDLMNHKDELFVGNFGILGERAANFAVQKSDLLLVLGSRLSIPNIGYQSHLFSPKSFKIMVDIDKNELQKSTIKIDLPICENLQTFLPKLKDANITKWTEWIAETQKWKKTYPIFQPEYRTNTKKINSFFFIEELSKRLKDNHIIVTDMGTSYTCTMQSIQMNGKARLFTSSACCSMGYGLPGAIGAYIANPKKDVILIAGDGGFQMNIQELQTIIHNKIPLKIFLLNNNGYLAISLMQDNLFKGKYVGANPQSGVSNPNFIKIAESYGIKAYKFNNNSELIDGIDKVLNMDGCVLCEISMIENQLLIPRVQSSKDVDGKIVSSSLERMFPYLSDEEMEKLNL
jgi:acetolactate synthase-1/2/3 large subunit